MNIINLLLLVLATVLFFLAALNTQSRINLVAMGLFAWVLSILLGVATHV
jgi:uncharacterized membrane protein YccC